MMPELSARILGVQPTTAAATQTKLKVERQREATARRAWRGDSPERTPAQGKNPQTSINSTASFLLLSAETLKITMDHGGHTGSHDPLRTLDGLRHKKSHGRHIENNETRAQNQRGRGIERHGDPMNKIQLTLVAFLISTGAWANTEHCSKEGTCVCTDSKGFAVTPPTSDCVRSAFSQCRQILDLQPVIAIARASCLSGSVFGKQDRTVCEGFADPSNLQWNGSNECFVCSSFDCMSKNSGHE